MKTFQFKFWFYMICFLTLLPLVINGQFNISRSSFGNGSGSIVGENNTIRNSIGQTIIGQAVNSESNILFGFWNANKTLVDVDDNDLLPKKYELFQNYPNPFNPTTNIKYSIPEASNVLIEVFNILGQRVSVLVDEEKKPGFYVHQFNATNLASGFYVYRISAKNFVNVKKMMFLK